MSKEVSALRLPFDRIIVVRAIGDQREFAFACIPTEWALEADINAKPTVARHRRNFPAMIRHFFYPLRFPRYSGPLLTGSRREFSSANASRFPDWPGNGSMRESMQPSGNTLARYWTETKPPSR
jgi:hypothetical protein